MHILDIATIVALMALNIDIFLQNQKVYRRKSSKDISLPGLSVRYIAIFIILTKYVAINDKVLVFGQSLIALNVMVYIVLVYRYRRSSV